MSVSEPPVRPGAEPFAADGDALGILLIHGFTGSPAAMRPWGEFLAARGHTVRAPRLPGHGTTYQYLNTTRWPDWYAECKRHLVDLRTTCDTVAVCALSMGGSLALRLAEQHEVDALVLVNPYLVPKAAERIAPIARFLMPSVKGIINDIKLPGQDERGDERVPVHALASVLNLQHVVRADLARVDAPTLLFRSREDHVVSERGRDLLMQALANGVEYVELLDSYHVATLDNDAPGIFAASAEFIERNASIDD